MILPAAPWSDCAFLVLIAAVMVGKYFDFIYPDVNRQHIAILGHIGLFHMALLSLMLERRVRETGFGFLPSGKEWRIGAVNFLFFLPCGAALALRCTPPISCNRAWCGPRPPSSGSCGCWG